MTKKRKWIWSLTILGICAISIITIVPLVLTTQSNNQVNNFSPKKEVPVVYYDDKATPITNGSYSFSTYDSKNDSINISNGPTNTTPSNGVESNAQLTTNYLYNEYESNQAKNTVGINFYSNDLNVHSATAWILDYKLTDDGSYPLTWYFAMNAHAIQYLKVPNDTITPERYETNSQWNNTEYIEFVNLTDFSLNKNFDSTSYQQTKLKAIDENGNSIAKTIFIGNDFLKTSPSMFSNDSRWEHAEEYADFAVMEITFENEQQAKSITNDYFDNKDNQFKYLKQSFLAHPEKIESNDYSLVGFYNDKSNSSETNDLGITVSKQKNPSQNEQKTLSSLSSTPYYNSYTNTIGMFDPVISFSYYSYQYVENIDQNLSKTFIPWGLMYPIDYGNLSNSSEGAMMVDSKDYTYRIHFLSDQDASVGLVQALYCEGFNYQGTFGKYNLDGYDLIDGGFANQKKSYRDGLIQLYGNENIKTNLYPNGVNR